MVTKKSKDISYLKSPAFVHEYAVMTKTEVGESFSTSLFTHMSAQVTGDFGGGTVGFEGSLDDKEFFPIKDKYGNYILIDSPCVIPLPVDYLHVRPVFEKKDEALEASVKVITFGKGQ